jgi:hypothetical protein
MLELEVILQPECPTNAANQKRLNSTQVIGVQFYVTYALPRLNSE